MGIENSRPRLDRLLYLLPLLLSLAVSTPAQAEILGILSQNMNRLFDDIDDGNNEEILSREDFRKRVADAATQFSGEFRLPRIIALQEVENHNVLRQIADRLHDRYQADYRPVLIPGQDPSGINIAFLVHSSVEIRAFKQLFRDLVLTYDSSPLYSRPPLYLEACYLGRCIVLLNLHLRSMRGIDSPESSERVARKRLQQAQTVAIWSNHLQQARPATPLLVLGDFNALTPADTHVDVAGIIRGNPDNARSRLQSRDLVDPDLVDLTMLIPHRQRYSYIFRHKKQQLDYMFTTESLAADVDSIAFSRIDYSFSDHAGLRVHFQW
jgi:endonuclease/exonuclease/phosphatase family metal-dependent hydrolase